MTKVRVNWGVADNKSASAVFEVFNTNHKSILVLARDEQEAMSVAHTANHIYSSDQKMALHYSRMAHQVRQRPNNVNSDCWKQISNASRMGLRGTLHILGLTCKVGDEELKL